MNKIYYEQVKVIHIIINLIIIQCNKCRRIVWPWRFDLAINFSYLRVMHKYFSLVKAQYTEINF